MTDAAADLRTLLANAPAELRREVFFRLRREISIHPLEEEWNISAEAILEAIQRSPDLTKRGIRGILAEASFSTTVVSELQAAGWSDVTPGGDHPYDTALRDGAGLVTVQVKLQRRRAGRPMRGDEAPRGVEFSADCFVVETQKTRGGERSGAKTRPYRFGDFDLLAVSLSPSTGDWSRFLYTVARWLIADPVDPSLIYKYQPVPASPNDGWTADLLTCIAWFRSGELRSIRREP